MAIHIVLGFERKSSTSNTRQKFAVPFYLLIGAMVLCGHASLSSNVVKCNYTTLYYQLFAPRPSTTRYFSVYCWRYFTNLFNELEQVPEWICDNTKNLQKPETCMKPASRLLTSNSCLSNYHLQPQDHFKVPVTSQLTTSALQLRETCFRGTVSKSNVSGTAHSLTSLSSFVFSPPLTLPCNGQKQIHPKRTLP